MSNQPKITYRSDTTACTYQMMQHGGMYTVQVIQFDIVQSESPRYAFEQPWRNTIDTFFDIITIHINSGEWR